jgi:hypothetical protein
MALIYFWNPRPCEKWFPITTVVSNTIQPMLNKVTNLRLDTGFQNSNKLHVQSFVCLLHKQGHGSAETEGLAMANLFCMQTLPANKANTVAELQNFVQLSIMVYGSNTPKGIFFHRYFTTIGVMSSLLSHSSHTSNLHASKLWSRHYLSFNFEA